MRLDTLLPDGLLTANILPPPIAETLICGLTADSRAVMPGYLFAALSGIQQDGRQFVGQAIERGAAAVLATEKACKDIKLSEDMQLDVPIICAANPRRAFAQMAGRFFEQQPDIVACVTGTNGKTSTVNYLRQLWQSQGYVAASLGTLGVEGQCAKTQQIAWPLQLTTPEPVTLHATMRDLAAHQISHLAVEASSHGLAQYRLDGTRIMLAGFTNLSRDHFDYHADEKTYLAAKQRLFTELLDEEGTAIICVAQAAGQQIAKATSATGRRVFTTGTPKADLVIMAGTQHIQGQSFTATYQRNHYQFTAPLIGSFQAQNLEVAFGIALANGADIEALCAASSNLVGARGRMQYIGMSEKGAAIYVDYAHTPDALYHALMALRAHSEPNSEPDSETGNLHIIFGCGGDRDKGKRKQMGAVAAQLCAHIYVTDDNPRTENAAAIRAEIMAACPQAHDIGQRAEAIATAIKAAENGDIILIAGKGHEQGQIINDEILPFDDAEMATKLIANNGAGA